MRFKELLRQDALARAGTTTKGFNNRAAAAVSFLLVLGAVAVAPVATAHAADMPRFSIHVDAPVVTTDTTSTIEPGMSRSDVEGVLGEPVRTGSFARSHTTAWDYDFRDVWGYPSTFSVIFNDTGSVVSKASIRKDY